MRAKERMAEAGAWTKGFIQRGALTRIGALVGLGRRRL